MTRVLIIIDKPEIAGGQQALLILCTNLNADEFSPLVVTSRGKGLNDQLRDAGVMVENVEMNKRFSLLSIWKLASIIRKGQIGIIHAFGLVSGVFAVIAAKMAGSGRVIYSQNGIHYRKEKGLLLHLRVFMEKFVISNSFKMVCCCQYDYDESVRCGLLLPDRGVVVYNGIETEKYRLLSRNSDITSLKKRFGVEGKRVIVAVGRLDYQKNHPFLILVMNTLVQKLHNVVLLIVGNGEKHDCLREMITKMNLQKKIILMGHRSDYLNIILCGDVFVNCSHWEGVSIALMEAISLGKPVVVSNINGNRELVIDDRNGIIVQNGDVTAFATALETILLDDKLRERFSAGSLFLAQEKADCRSMVTDTQELYRSM